MTEWYVDPGLARLIAQMRIRFPRITIGTIGDSAHTVGDHVPERDHSVDAADFMVNQFFSTDEAQLFVDAMVRNRDKRISYIIWNKQIISPTIQPWKWRPYNGSDPHTNHVHLSVNDKYPNDRSQWDLTTGKPMDENSIWSHNVYAGNDPNGTQQAYGALWLAMQRTGELKTAVAEINGRLDRIETLLANLAK